jgi:hypothetical protein
MQAIQSSSIRRDQLSSPAPFLGGLAVVIALAITAAPVRISAARADAINLDTCNSAAVSQPFAPWGDLASYELAPGGSFETPSWALSGAAQRVRGSEPYAATGSLGSWSLSLPAGSSAQSPPTCVDAAYPSARFFIAGTGVVAMTIVDGNVDIPAGTAVAASNWLPTPVMLTSSAVAAATSNGVAQVSLRLTALSGSAQVDDVFIDPWQRG